MLKIIFAGTPEIASHILEEIIQHPSYNVVQVYTQADKPVGRGLKIQSSPVKQAAIAHHIPVFSPIQLKDPVVLDALKMAEPDVIIVVAYGQLIPPEILALPRLGCINVHTSLLPKYRGAAPIQRAIQAGETQTGVTIMQMDAGLDTGPILKQAVCTIAATDTSQDILEKLTALGGITLMNTLQELEAGTLIPVVQDNSAASYAAKLSKQEAKIDWTASATEIDCLIRAFIPWPVAFTIFNGSTLRVWQAMPCLDIANDPAHDLANDLANAATAGTIVALSPTGLDVATGNGILRITSLQWPGKRQMTVAEYLNAPTILKVGMRLGE